MDFPNLDNINVYQYENVFDYSRWTAGTRIKICKVPWCGDFENVVKFDAIAARDEYLDKLSGDSITLTSDFRVLPDGSIKLPVPFDNLARYNYIVVDFPQAAPARLLDYEVRSAKRRWLFFIDDMKMLAPSTTEARISLDWWSEYIYDVEISRMILERGHAPLAAVNASEYLQDPINNCEYLLSPDVTGAGPERVKSVKSAILNDGDMLLCFATTGDLSANWGTKAANSWEVVSFDEHTQDGAPSNVKIYAVGADAYHDFMVWIEANMPQFIPTVQGIFLLPAKLAALTQVATLGDIAIYAVEAGKASLASIRLQPSDFGFPEEYRDFAKLYTYPYSRIELTDMNGGVTEIRIEELGSNASIQALANLVFPYMNIEMLLQGIGGDTLSTISFNTLDSADFAFAGTWYKHIMKFNIPLFAITQSMKRNYDFSTHFSRRQQTAELNLQYDNTAAAADMQATNTALAVAASVANQSATHVTGTNINNANNQKLYDDVHYDREFSRTYNSIQAAQTLATQSVNTAQTIGSTLLTVGVAVAAVALAPETGGSSLAGAASLISAGAVGTAVSSVGGAALSIGATSASNSILLSTNVDIMNASLALQLNKLGNATDLSTANLAAQYALEDANLTRSNTCTTTQVANNVALTKSNAAASRDLMLTGITRATSQAELQAPARFGATSDASSVSTKPMGLLMNIVTQNDHAIHTAGDAFARYGYMLNQNWRVDDLNVMTHFTYWKASEIWMTGAQSTVESAQEIIKGILLNGVTVWRVPDEIGAISIYDNERRMKA